MILDKEVYGLGFTLEYNRKDNVYVLKKERCLIIKYASCLYSERMNFRVNRE